ncbi:MAG: hypothetical protein P8J27_02805 [Mariniblastus sp.]|nr:hypothetical protein [Mariniblastus sp.]
MPNSLTVAKYSNDGDLLETCETQMGDLNSQHIEYFKNKFTHLTGDLELPYESVLPGDNPFLEFRIGSDLHGAYVLYYFHDEIIFSSLLLSGTNEESERDLMDIIKFLLLDSEDNEDPTEEEIDAALASHKFQFEKIESRPAVHEIPNANGPEEASQCEVIEQMNQCLAAAFFAIQRESS